MRPTVRRPTSALLNLRLSWKATSHAVELLQEEVTPTAVEVTLAEKTPSK